MKQFAFASYAQYFLGGAVITIIGSVLPQLLAYYDLSYTVGGQLVFLASAGFVVGVPLSYFLMNRLRERTLLSLAALLIAIGQLGVLLLPPISWIFLFTFLSSIGVGMIETAVATFMMEMFTGRRAVVMSYLEVSFGVGALLMPVIASFLIAQDIWRFSFLVTGGLGILIAVLWQVISFSKEEANTAAPLDASAPPPRITKRHVRVLLLILFVFMIFMYTGIEGSLNNFLSSVFIDFLGAVPYYASLSIGVFWTAMVIGRLATGWVIRKVPYHRFLIWSITGTLAGLIAFILLKNAVAGFSLVVVLGLTMSGIYSITLVYANHTLPGMARVVTSLVTGFAGMGNAVFPALIGFTMDRAGAAAALWYVVGIAGLYTVALLMIFVMHVKLKKHENEQLAMASDFE